MRVLYRETEPAFKPEEWCVTETAFSQKTNRERESIFAVANGYIGVRGFFEEGYYGRSKKDSDPFVILNGVYEFYKLIYNWKRPGYPDRFHAIIKQINPLRVTVFVDGEKVKMCKEGYRRTLDFKTGVLTREFVYTTSAGKKVKLIYERFADQADKHMLATRIRVESSADAEIVLRSEIGRESSCKYFTDNTRTWKGILTNIRLKREDGLDVADYSTRKSKFDITCAVKEKAEGFAESHSQSGDNLYGEFKKQVKAGETCVYERIIGFACSKDTENQRDFIIKKVNKESVKGYDGLLKESIPELDKFWEFTGIHIDTDPIVAQGIRFSAFQVFQSAGRDGYTNISANGLSGTVYSGHTFWDTEMYMMPIFTYGLQHISRELLMYRYNILDNSRRRAKQMDDEGALYSWNTINGEECGTVFEAATAQYHINGDIAYAMEAYYDASGDEEFMVNYGTEMLFEMSKCLAHRGGFVPTRGGKFCINVVCGPDEYNPIVDNNLYTNLLTKKMFLFTLRMKDLLAKKYPDKLKQLEEKCKMDDKEFALIREAADKMYFPYNEEYGIYMQDDNFMYKDVVNIDDIPQEKLPLLNNLHPLNLWRCQICKQADIVLSTFVFSEFYSKDQIKKIFDYYEPKTIHDSSLSASVHSIVACDIGYTDQAYLYLRQASRMDLDNVNGNTANGLHAACMGSAWMLLVNGYGGLRVFNGELHFKPIMCERWKEYAFKINYHDTLISVEVDGSGTLYKVIEGKNEKITLSHYGKEITVDRKGVKVANE